MTVNREVRHMILYFTLMSVALIGCIVLIPGTVDKPKPSSFMVDCSMRDENHLDCAIDCRRMSCGDLLILLTGLEIAQRQLDERVERALEAQPLGVERM